MKPNPNESDPVLCFVKDQWAFFTAKDLKEQSGCDWDDRPYQHNASIPHEDGTITRVAFYGDFETPEDFTDSLSADDINAGVMAWISGSRWSSDEVNRIVIPAGTTLSEFKRLIKLGSGKVYTEELSNV